MPVLPGDSTTPSSVDPCTSAVLLVKVTAPSSAPHSKHARLPATSSAPFRLSAELDSSM
ncbi:hypothetical protein D9M71_675130 [compost metagenome]